MTVTDFSGSAHLMLVGKRLLPWSLGRRTQGRQAALVNLAAALPCRSSTPCSGVRISTAIAWSHRANGELVDLPRLERR